MKKSIVILLIILIAMAISSCDGMKDAIAPDYEITFYKNPPDGSKNKMVKVKIKEGKKLPNAEKDMKWTFDNYKFDGWETKKGKKREKALDNSPLYAQWKPANE